MLKHDCSATAQIAAMEAKLASMAKRKPADEDYVPGQVSGSASPMPDDLTGDIEMDVEEEMGLEEGQRAADDLEREMDSELRGDATEGDLGDSLPPRPPSPEGDELPVPRARAPTILPESTLPSQHALPPTPTAVHGVDDKAKAREQAFKKGLAGLPKKPVA